MLRRILAIVSFALAIHLLAEALLALRDFPVPLGPAIHHPERVVRNLGGLVFLILVWSATFIFPLVGTVASFCSGVHLYRGLRAHAPLWRLLWVSNSAFMIFTVLYLLFVQFVANHRASIRFAPLADYVSYYSVLLVPFSVIAIYLIILFSRGADADLSQD